MKYKTRSDEFADEYYQAEDIFTNEDTIQTIRDKLKMIPRLKPKLKRFFAGLGITEHGFMVGSGCFFRKDGKIPEEPEVIFYSLHPGELVE